VPFDFKELELKGCTLVQPKVFGDERGFFMETYKKEDFERAGIGGVLVQENHSRSGRGVLRGLHYQQHSYAQAKLVRCIRGEILDVGVDLREGSQTYGKHVAVRLSEKNKSMLYVPRGFAHGYEVLSEDAEVLYAVDNQYAPTQESGLLWNDPALGIDWPIKEPLLNDRDRHWPALSQQQPQRP